MNQGIINESRISVVWDNEQKTIQRFDFPKRWTWEDFGKAKRYADSLLDEYQHNIGVIYVLHPTNALPSNAISMTGSNFSKRHPRAVILVIVASGHLVKVLWQTLTAVYPLARQFGRRTDTLEEARKLITQYLTPGDPKSS